MEKKIKLQHPAGKKAVSMDKEKYDIIEKSLLNGLKTDGVLSHKDMLRVLTEDFKNNEQGFEGSIEWHMEWVKLDLEARKKITRIADTAPIKFRLS